MSPELLAALAAAVAARKQAAACLTADFSQYSVYAQFGGVNFPGLGLLQVAQACEGLCNEAAIGLYNDYMTLAEVEGVTASDANTAYSTSP